MDIDSYLKDNKIINDIIHGNISLSKLATLIIDTPEFQRLRYIKQLSTCYFVFPNAIHTRFEHSIGTYQICKKMLFNLKKNSKKEELNIIKNIPELQSYFLKNNNEILLDDYIIELVSIGALCHDLGHGPFSHLFDDYFLKNKDISIEYKYHENRSCSLIKNIINKNEILKSIIIEEHIKFIHNIINPNKEIHKEYIYQIVSNNLNGIDIDKFDYLTRDSKMLNINISFNYNRLIENAMIINNIISFPEKVDSDIINLFQSRHYMHKKVYSHKVVISSLLNIIELLENLDKLINFTEEISNLNEFIKYTDDYMLIIARYISSILNNEYTKKIKESLKIIDTHSFYKLIYYNYIDIDELDKTFEETNETDTVKKYQSIIGFISGKKGNPLESVYLYNSKDPYNSIKILTNSDSVRLLPNKYQEKLLMVFNKK
jgi:HD superfamily phosphohydrolase